MSKTNKENNFAYIDGANSYMGITYLQDIRKKIEFVKEKAPNGDKTPPGHSS